MNDSFNPNTTAGLFIEESDDEGDNDMKDDSNHNINDDNESEMLSHATIATQELMNESNNNNHMQSEEEIKHEQENEEEEEDDFDEDDDEEQLPIADVIALLTISWRNEKLAPDVLQYEHEFVERVKQTIEDKEDEIFEEEEKIAESMNDNQFNNKILSSSMYWFKKELQRIRYVLNSYLRIRLWKIQKFTLHILSDIDAWNRLSNAEQDFATAYSDLNERHFKNCFLKDLPNKYQTMTEAEMFVKPDLNKFVVIKSNVNDDNIMIEDGKQHVNLQQGNIFVSRYKNFKNLVASAAVDLI